MNARQAKQTVKEWVEANTQNWPGIQGAHLVGGITTMPIRSLLPMLQQMGMVTAEDVGIETLADRLRAEVVGQRGVQMLPIVIGAWARKLHSRDHLNRLTRSHQSTTVKGVKSLKKFRTANSDIKLNL